MHKITNNSIQNRGSNSISKIGYGNTLKIYMLHNYTEAH